MASHLSESLVYFIVLLFHQENHILKPFNALLTNFEMETAGIYTMAALLGHRALSINLILANRQSKKFSTQGSEGMESLILDVLNRIVTEL